MPSPRKLLISLAILCVALGLGLYALYSNPSGPQGSGVALVGGPFQMVDQNNKPVTEKTYAGKPMLLFFGYTFCPDVCPTELQVMASALDTLGKAGEDIQPIFVSVDPERDTPHALAGYVGSFGPRFIGLTGTPEQVAQMAKAYKVYYARQENLKSPKDYLMDHSSIVYLMGADGKFLKHFTYTTDAKALADGLRTALNR